MKKIIFLILLLVPFNVYALNDTAKSSIVMDIDSGRILYQNNSNEKMLIASTTKIMTFLTTIVYAYDKLESSVIVSDEILKMYGTNMYLNLNEKLTIKDLLYGLMLRSGNDASVVLATNVAGSIDEFVNLMNLKAKELGMNNTIFKNPHGLDDEVKNYSTAYDLAILTRYLYLNYPLYKQIAGEKYYDFASNFKSYSLVNRCKILFTYDKITTAKNGYTPASGKSLVTTASNNNLNLLIVTLNDDDIYQNHQRLYEYYFNKYNNYLILDKDNFLIPSLTNQKYYLKNNFYYPLTKLEKDSIEMKVILHDNNQKTFGKINIFLKNKLIHEEMIYKIKTSVKRKNIILKIRDFFRNLFQ